MLFASCCGTTAHGQGVMVIDQVAVHSKGATLVSVDAKGVSKSEVAVIKSVSDSLPAVSRIGPGERVEVVGNAPAQMIVSEAVTAHLEPGTQIELPKVGEKEKPTASLKLLKGKMFITVSAEKLKREGNVEFRLETPKSLLAVKGTRFVAASGGHPDTVALLEGSVAVRDQTSGKFALLHAGQAADIAGGGEVVTRRMTQHESEYSQVFEDGELMFFPFEIDRKFAPTTTGTEIRPEGVAWEDRDNWIAKGGIYRGEFVEFAGFPSNGLRAIYEPDKPYLPDRVMLRLGFNLKAPRTMTKRMVGPLVIGVLARVRSSAPPDPQMLIDYPLPIGEKQFGEKRFGAFVPRTTSTSNAGLWNDLFLPYWGMLEIEAAEYSRDYRPKGSLNFAHCHISPNEPPLAPFVVEIASIQLVTLRGEKQ